MKDLIFRCSSLPNLVGKTGLGKTGEKEALKAYAAQYLDRFKEVKSKYLDKGIANEQEAIDMVNRVKGSEYRKNPFRYDNEYLTGECDILDTNENKVCDIKCSWDWFTFSDSIGDTSYEYQLRGYMELFEADEAEVIYCLTDMPDTMILKAMEREAYNWGGDLPDLVAIRIVKNSIYDLDNFNRFLELAPINISSVQKEIDKFVHIPESERIHIVNFKREDIKTKFMYKRLDEAREFVKKHFKL
jgi:hypothetical protein